jgi:hypothetical protein
MTPGQLVKAVSIALDVSEETVVQHDRNLVVAGLRTTGARGRNAPSVTPLDAARLVAGVLGSVKVKDTVQVVQSLEATKVMLGRDGYSPLPFPRFGELQPRDHSFVDALTAIIEETNTSQMFEDFAGYARRFGGLAIHVRNWGATISYLPRLEMVGMTHIQYSEPRSEKDKKRQRSEWDWLDFNGVEQDRMIRGNCLMMLGRFFQQDKLSSAEVVFRSWRSALKKAAA